MAGTAFGWGAPMYYPTSPLIPQGTLPFGTQGSNINPWTSQQLYGQNPYTVQSLQQILQVVPQQLQHLQQLEQQLQQQLLQLQQFIQIIPAQLAQLQQLIQSVPQQLQQVQQPFGQASGAGSLPLTTPWGISHQFAGVQPGLVM